MNDLGVLYVHVRSGQVTCTITSPGLDSKAPDGTAKGVCVSLHCPAFSVPFDDLTIKTSREKSPGVRGFVLSPSQGRQASIFASSRRLFNPVAAVTAPGCKQKCSISSRSAWQT